MKKSFEKIVLVVWLLTNGSAVQVRAGEPTQINLSRQVYLTGFFIFDKIFKNLVRYPLKSCTILYLYLTPYFTLSIYG